MPEFTKPDKIRALLGSEPSRAAVWDILELGGPLRSVFDTEPSLMYFKEGNRNAAIALLADLEEFAPELYFQMKEEARTRAVIAAQEAAKQKESEDV